MSSLKIGEILVKQGLLKPDQLALAMEEQKKTGQKLTNSIIQLGYLKDNQILRAVEKHFAVPGVEVNTFEIDATVIAMIPKDVCEKNTLIPLQKAGNTLVVAFADPSNIIVKEDLRFITRCRIQAVVGTESAIMSGIEKYYGGSISTKSLNTMGVGDEDDFILSAGPATEVIDQDGGSEDAPIIKFVNSILADAIRKKVSDIHFEPYEKKYRVRFRIDGNLVEATAPPAGTAAAIASRIKIMSKLDIAEKRRPQDGRLKVRTKAKEMDFRVSVLPTLWGEKVVLRLLDKSNLQLDMTKLGFEEDDLKLFKATINLPQGMVLITGPTGSGKTTTIYSALAELNQPDVNISTAEDPVEFNLEGINQVQMNPDIDLNFSSALKSFLRQDPDVVMVGEIRDLETAEIAFKAASTGHLVVSTLHTNDAPGTVIRLTEMGVAPYIITSTVNLIVAQRLVGKVCESCKAPVEVPAQTLLNLGVPQAEIGDYKLMRGKGCANCNNTGIKGRLAIYELLAMTEKMKEAILKGASTGQLRFLAREQGMRTLRRSALLKLKRGVTTIEEVLNASVKDT
ncbi:type IV-A pilus assembly ATPase PilB [Bdellovibrio bacteriovorus]|uniref:Type IV pilus biogenesis protein PilB n=1 Tax=Bdellovibrio bacteriovorus (strain ATCC 15356 / DSM 50701 / NCIMB 9529 / HD100) TaxID=264462 RepID=Q6MMW4_BDEBA|nr:type IV-A pilus assembly ATPase PilB [Bdellovibrio bacteriovorus]AHZ84061.1 type II secretion system protein E [Bdellovibrio bacteriovorus]BEV67944.1 Type II secretion system protein E [Bdellovibrio bacteriovorus]CAE79389.1 type IV pilus biogenesis protein PilB [Bdellovibrio bacteriovorus HD100]